MLVRPLVQPRLKKALGQKISPDGTLIATGGLKHGQKQTPEGATFYAPLQINQMDYAGQAPYEFERASPGLYEKNGVWRPANDNAPRFQDGMLLMEPASTNLCTNYNAEPDAALTNVTPNGTGTLQRVDDSAALDAAGLGAVGNGYAIEVISGGGGFNAYVVGSAPATEHTLSCWVRKVGATGSVVLKSSLSAASVTITNDTYQRIDFTTSDGGLFQVRCTGGATARFVLNQMEALPVASSPIITQGASASRAVDLLDWKRGSLPFNWRNLNPTLDNLNEGWNSPTCANVTRLDGARRVDNLTSETCNFLRRDDQVLTQGAWYRIRVKVSEFSATSGEIALLISNQAVAGAAMSAVRDYEFLYYAATVNDNRIQLNLGSPVNMTAQVDFFEVVELADFFSFTEGMALVTWSPEFSDSDYPAGVRYDSNILSLRDTAGAGPLINHSIRTTGQLLFESSDGVNSPFVNVNTGDIVKGQRYPVALRWSTVPSELQIGVRVASGWVWGTPTVYAGSFLDDGLLRAVGRLFLPQRIEDLQIFDEDKGTAWIEANYP